MDVIRACVELLSLRQSIPDELAVFRDCDSRRTISMPGIAEQVSVDLWAPMMAAHLEAEGLIYTCENERDLLATLIDCLLKTDFMNLSNCPQLAGRGLEIAMALEMVNQLMQPDAEN